MGPSDVFVQSKVRMRSPISPPPASKSRAGSSRISIEWAISGTTGILGRNIHLTQRFLVRDNFKAKREFKFFGPEQTLANAARTISRMNRLHRDGVKPPWTVAKTWTDRPSRARAATVLRESLLATSIDSKASHPQPGLLRTTNHPKRLGRYSGQASLRQRFKPYPLLGRNDSVGKMFALTPTLPQREGATFAAARATIIRRSSNAERTASALRQI